MSALVAAGREAGEVQPHLVTVLADTAIPLGSLIGQQAGNIAEIVLLQDLSFIERRSKDTRQYLIILIATLGGVIALVACAKGVAPILGVGNCRSSVHCSVCRCTSSRTADSRRAR